MCINNKSTSNYFFFEDRSLCRNKQSSRFLVIFRPINMICIISSGQMELIHVDFFFFFSFKNWDTVIHCQALMLRTHIAKPSHMV